MQKAFKHSPVIYCWIAVIGILIAASILQSHMLLNWDVSFLMYVSDRALAGGSYFKNIAFATPTILHLYMLPIIVGKIFSLNSIEGLQLTVFSVALFSLMLCYRLLSMLFSKKDNPLFYLFFILLTLVFFILPGHEFGQREHFMILFTYPYFCLAALRLKNKPISFSFALFIGLFSGFGFAIKPFFLLSFALVELYIMYQKRNLFAWVRIESITIPIISLIYMLCLFIFFPEFFHTFLPQFRDLYYGKNGNLDFPISSLLFNDCFLICLSSLSFFIVSQKK